MSRLSDLHKQMVRDVSRTFALSIEQLPGTLREATGVAYLLLRVSDFLEDNDLMVPERKAALLRTWARILDGVEPVWKLTQNLSSLDSRDPEAFVAKNANLILDHLNHLSGAIREPIARHIYQSTLGMARWQEHGPYVEDEAALDDYMHEVAGRVGYLVTELFSWYSSEIDAIKEQLLPLSRQCGLALQTVNIIRGLPEDYRRGWVFVPESYLRQVDLTRATLLDGAHMDKTMAVVSMLADKADRHLSHGLDYVKSFPRRYHGIRLSLMWPFFFAVRTLAHCRQNPLVLRGDAKLTRQEVRRIVSRTKLLGWSNSWLDHYYHSLAQIP